MGSNRLPAAMSETTIGELRKAIERYGEAMAASAQFSLNDYDPSAIEQRNATSHVYECLAQAEAQLGEAVGLLRIEHLDNLAKAAQAPPSGYEATVQAHFENVRAGKWGATGYCNECTFLAGLEKGDGDEE